MNNAYQNFLDRIKQEKTLKIFGAGKFAKTLGLFLERNGVDIECFVVTDIAENPSVLLHKPVLTLERLTPSEHCNLIVGFENREILIKTVDILLRKQIKNIIMVPPRIVDDIYCNYFIDGHSVESLCSELKKKEKVFVYVNDQDAEHILYYLQSRNVKIDGICTDLGKLPFYSELSVVSCEYIADQSPTMVLTMNSVGWQRCFITRLRKMGIEGIVLISDKNLKAMREGSRRLLWEEQAGFRLIEDRNVEKNHYIVQKQQGSGAYRWRVTAWDRHIYEKHSLEMIRSGKMLEDYQKQFPQCSYLSYTEVPLCEVKKGELNLEVYMAKFYKDQGVAPITLPDWVIPIQVGKALTEVQIEAICDDAGDNISVKNVDYSEGTALYWMWKNTCGQDYIGLFHYRRQMVMGEDTLRRLLDYDVLLTVPTYVTVNTKTFFCEHYIIESDWNLMMRYIKEFDEDYYQSALIHERGSSYFPCNLFIMRRKYFDEMCTFIFGVLERVSGYYESICMTRKDRYLGYLVENLLSIYLLHHGSELKMAYTDMKFHYPINSYGEKNV